MKPWPENFLLPKSTDLDRSRHIGRVCAYLESLPLEQAWAVSVEEKKNKRSLEANAYYWGVVVEMISQATGYEAEEVHTYLCGTRWGWKDKRVPKTPRNPEGLESVPVRTTTMNAEGKRSVLGTAQFMEFIEFAVRFAAQKINILIPEPQSDWRQRAA